MSEWFLEIFDVPKWLIFIFGFTAGLVISAEISCSINTQTPEEILEQREKGDQ